MVVGAPPPALEMPTNNHGPPFLQFRDNGRIKSLSYATVDILWVFGAMSGAYLPQYRPPCALKSYFVRPKAPWQGHGCGACARIASHAPQPWPCQGALFCTTSGSIFTMAIVFQQNSSRRWSLCSIKNPLWYLWVNRADFGRQVSRFCPNKQ